MLDGIRKKSPALTHLVGGQHGKNPANHDGDVGVKNAPTTPANSMENAPTTTDATTMLGGIGFENAQEVPAQNLVDKKDDTEEKEEGHAGQKLSDSNVLPFLLGKKIILMIIKVEHYTQRLTRKKILTSHCDDPSRIVYSSILSVVLRIFCIIVDSKKRSS